jgi:regulator of cell morphogenesis and NO signaling
LDGAAVLAELNQAYAASKNTTTAKTDWNTADFGTLIEHIVNTHHAYLKRELPAISQLTTKILRVHGAKHRELSKVHRLFHLLKLELEQHLIKEEEELFPRIVQYAANPSTELLASVVSLIDTIESEHTNAGDILKELDALTDHFQVPADGCTSYRLTYQKLHDLESDLFQHIHLENNILHPRLKSLLQ